MKRRVFVKNIGLSLIGSLSYSSISGSEFSPNKNVKIPIGLCNYSLRGLQLSAMQIIKYAIEKKLDSVLFNTLKPFESLEKSHLLELKSMAQSNGVSIYIGVGSISEESVQFKDISKHGWELLREGIQVASTLNSPIVGCRIGALIDRYKDGGIEKHMETVINHMKSVRSFAEDAGIKFAFENHAGDLRTEELQIIINETGKDICGALFDPANALWAMEDPMIALKKLGSSIICTSVRDIQVWETTDGAVFQGMAIGEGILDFQMYAKTMAEFCQGVPMHIETISNSARPIPFLNPEFWKGFPDLSGADIIDFLKIIKRGKPQELLKPQDNKDKRSFDIELQQKELLSSINFLHKNCNAGLKL